MNSVNEILYSILYCFRLQFMHVDQCGTMSIVTGERAGVRERDTRDGERGGKKRLPN